MATRVRSAKTRAKDHARNRQWQLDNKDRIAAHRERAKAARRAHRAKPSTQEISAANAETNWIETERLIRVVVLRAITEGTLERGSKWFDMTADEVRAVPLPNYSPHGVFVRSSS